MKGPKKACCYCIHHVLRFILVLGFTFFLSCSGISLKEDLGSSPCAPQKYAVAIPIRVRLVFVGAAPMFMREPSWTESAQAEFSRLLSKTVRHVAIAPMEDDNQIAPFVPGPALNSCSLAEFTYDYETAIAPNEVLAKLDRVLSDALTNSRSMFAPGTDVADQFYQILTDGSYIRSGSEPDTYDILLYNAASVAMQRGYQSERGAPVRTFGVASSQRFAFLDVGAKPYFLNDAGTSTPGELLMVSSHTPASYAAKLHSVVAKLVTPPASPNMHRFPRENRLLFSLRKVDASAVIGRLAGVGGDSLRNRSIGVSFDSGKFVDLLQSVFKDSITPAKGVSIEVLTPDMDEDARISMGIARAFSMHGLEMVLDSERLLQDILGDKSDRSGYFVDSSFVAHVPIFLFSFADDSRITHFQTREELRAKVVGKQAVFIVENRLKDELDEHTSVTSDAAKEVMQLLCGLDGDSLGYMNAQNGRVPMLLTDIMQRHILAQELDWSFAAGARKAMELLNFEGLDERLIPHEKGSAIAVSRDIVNVTLEQLQKAWHMSRTSEGLDRVESTTFELIQKSRDLADKLHDEICNQPLPEEILLKAEAEFDTHDAESLKAHPLLFYLKWVHIPMVLGVVLGALIHLRKQRVSRARGTGLGEIPVTSPKDSSTTHAYGEWFSTLSTPDKRKVH